MELNILKQAIITDKNINYKKAFTLAEVLITLAIIGIVAALTIPALVNYTNDLELKSAWKKAYAELANTYNQIKNDNGGTLSGLGLTNINFANLFIPYYKVLNLGYSTTAMMPDGTTRWMQAIKTMNGNVGYGALGIQGGLYIVILNDGKILGFEYTGGDISNTWSFNGANLAGTVTGSNHIFVDVNGVKGPNILGKDIFGTMIYKDNLVPFGTYLPSASVPIVGGSLQNTCNTSSTGHSCSADYLSQ